MQKSQEINTKVHLLKLASTLVKLCFNPFMIIPVKYLYLYD